MKHNQDLPRGGWETKVAGVTYEGRQDNIDPSMEGERLLLKAVKNDFDEYAVGVFREKENRDGRKVRVQIGFILSRRSEVVWHLLDDGFALECVCLRVVGGGEKNLGVRIYVFCDEAPLGDWLGGE